MTDGFEWGLGFAVAVLLVFGLAWVLVSTVRIAIIACRKGQRPGYDYLMILWSGLVGCLFYWRPAWMTEDVVGWVGWPSLLIYLIRGTPLLPHADINFWPWVWPWGGVRIVCVIAVGYLYFWSPTWMADNIRRALPYGLLTIAMILEPLKRRDAPR